MSSLEDGIRDALQSEAGRLREVRPLRLEPIPYQLRRSSPRRRARLRWAGLRWAGLRWAWLAPVTAAALVIALAVALVIVRTQQNGSAVPAVPQPSAPTIFPRYYVALEQSDYNTGNATRLVVGDSVTGKTLAAFNAPAGAAFEGRTPVGAADDQTFIVAETHDKGKPPYPPGTADGPRAWYLLRVSPGSANPVTMTTLPLQVTARNLPVTDTVLSADGRYLAVASGDATTQRADLRVYSVATGHLVHAWTLASASASSALFPSDLSWVNGDTTVAFAIRAGSRVQVRTVPVAAPGTALLTASRVVWSQYSPAVLQSPPKAGTVTSCDQPTLTADGHTVTCSTFLSSPSSSPPWPMLEATEWLAYPIWASTTRRVIARIPPAVAKQTTRIQGGGVVAVSVSTDTVIGYSFVVPTGDTGPMTIHEFIASDGTVRQLGTGTIPPWPALAWPALGLPALGFPAQVTW